MRLSFCQLEKLQGGQENRLKEVISLIANSKIMKHLLFYSLFIILIQSSKANTFTVLNANASGAGSLLEAIDNANSTVGNDVIEFNISGTPPHIIPLATTFPILISEGLTIDGSTQPDNGYTGACPKIVLDAAGVDSSVNTLVSIVSQNVSIYGLWFKNFSKSNSEVLYVTEQNVIIGAPGKKNLFTNNFNSVALIAANTEINSNYFGCNCEGTALDPNLGIAVVTYLPSDNLTIKDNLISGNTYGIILGSGTAPSNNIVIQGNKVGTDITGTVALGNLQTGINLTNLRNLTLGGAGSGEGNLVSGNGDEGCLLVSCSGTVFGNKVGTDITGTDTLPNDPFNNRYNTAFNCNGYSGIVCSLIVGGTGPGEQNVFFGNDIACNVADFSGHYEFNNNLMGQTLSGLVSPFQSTGFQLYYDTLEVLVRNNYLFGNSTGFFAQQTSNFLAEENIIGHDINGDALSLLTGFSVYIADSFVIQNNSISNCYYGVHFVDGNEALIAQNTIQTCGIPISLQVGVDSCHHIKMYRNPMLFNTYTVDLNNGLPNAANDDILPPVIEGSDADSTWGTSLPYALVDLCRDTTLLAAYPQGYDYSIPQITADASGHWVYIGALTNPNDYTAMQTDLDNNSSGFSERLTLGVAKSEKSSIRIYPVPAMEFFVVENLSGAEMREWQLFNSIGVLVLEGTMSGGSNEKIDVKKLSSGYYFMKVSSDHESFVMKCVKE